MFIRQRKYSKGFSFVEIVVVTGILMIGLVSLGRVSSSMVKGLTNDERFQKASYYAQEGIEAVRLIRDVSWGSNIANKSQGTTYYLNFTGGQWSITTTDPGPVEGVFARTVLFDDAYRDSSDTIVASGGTLDSGTKRVRVTVSWGAGNVSLTTYLTNIMGEKEALSVQFTGGTTDADLASFPNNSGFGDPAQSFRPTENMTATKAELFLKKATADPSDIYLELRSSGPRGTIMATSQTIDSSTLLSGYSWVTFTFNTPQSLVSGTSYFLRLRSTPDSGVPFSGAQGTVYWGWIQSALPTLYPDGIAYRYVTATGEQNLDTYDFSFKVYKKIQ